MNELQSYSQESFTDFKRFESKDLSYYVFEKIDFHKYLQPVSFFRSDFRGSKFTNIKFYKNNFDRSDFLNSIFIDCTFEKTQFGCCQMKNCYFKNVVFKNNFYRNTSIHSTTFVNCEFPDETFLINMQHCKLINCSFTGCSFEMSTTDNDIFEQCKFCDTNLATMHAENHKFINCDFYNTCIDSSYFFGYSIVNCNWNKVFFLYHGEHVQFEKIPIHEIKIKLEAEHRYNDILNFLIMQKVYEEIPYMLKQGFDYYQNKPYGRILNISLMLESLIFAAMYETITYDILYNSVIILEDIDLIEYSLDERIEINALFSKLQNALFLCPHTEKFIADIDKNSKSTLSIKFGSDDYDMCINTAKKILNAISDEKYWKLVEKKKGSWILIYSASTMVVLTVLPKIIKNFSDVYFDIKTKRQLSKKIISKLESSEISLNDIKKLTNASQEAELLLPVGKCINKNISKDMAEVVVSAITANM